MNNPTILSKPKEEINWDKIKRDLDFIKSFKSFCKSQNWRIVVYGGYGLDILLGLITRNHNDVDIVIYGQSTRESASTNIQEFLNQLIKGCTLKISENKFMVDIDLNSPGLGANIYYVQTAESPFTSLSKIITQSGETITNSKKQFPPPVKGKLDKFAIDVQNPHIHLADIISKQRTLVHKLSHNQDIPNLRLITNEAVVDEILNLS